MAAIDSHAPNGCFDAAETFNSTTNACGRAESADTCIRIRNHNPNGSVDAADTWQCLYLVDDHAIICVYMTYETHRIICCNFQLGSVRMVPSTMDEPATRETREQKRLRWLNYQLATYPLPVAYAVRFECSAPLLNVDGSKRQWEYDSKEWIIRRRKAYKAFVEETE